MFIIRCLFDRQKTRDFCHRNTLLACIGSLVCIGGLLMVSGYGQKMAVGSIPQVSLAKREYRILPEEEYLKLQDDEIDIAVGSLIIAKGIYPDIDIQKYLNQIDAMAKELEPKLKVCKSPNEIVKTISGYLFVKQKLKFEEDKGFIKNVLDEKRGNCKGFSFLYLSITERLQLPFYGIVAPDHMFVRYDDGSVKINIETTEGGDIRTEKQILEGRGVSYPLETTQDSIHLKNLTKRQLLFVYLEHRGQVYGERGDSDKALVDLNKVLNFCPNFDNALVNRGNVFRNKGDFDKAMQDYNKALSVYPKNATAYYNRGNAFKKEGDSNRAIQEFTKAISINQEYTDAYFNRGNTFREKGDFDKAIQDYTKTIAINPKFTKAYVNRGIALGTKGDYDKAIQDFNKAISVDPKDASAYNNRGLTYVRKEDSDKAIRDYTKAISVDPNYIHAYINRATALIIKGDFDKALPDLSRAIEMNSEVANLYFLRAFIYFDKGDKKNVLQDSKKAIELDSGYKSAVKKFFGKSKEYAEDEEFKKIIK